MAEKGADASRDLQHGHLPGKEAIKNLLAFLKWSALALFAGIVIGLIGTAFHMALSGALALRQAHPWLVWLLPVGGVLITALYKWGGINNDRGTNFVLIAVRTNEKLSFKTAPLIFATTLLTHLFGGSAGREGAALQLGGSLAAKFGRILHLDEKDARILTMCGMSAAFSALFGTPVTSAIFSMEVISVGVMYYSAIVPCVIAAVVGDRISSLFGIAPTEFLLTGVPEGSALGVAKVALLGVLCAVLSILFCVCMHQSAALYKKLIPNKYLCAAVGGLLVALLTLLVGTRDYNGAGMDVIARAVAGQARPEAFALKILFTALTLGAGFKGGEIVPAFFTGATFGNVIGKLLGLSPSFGAGLGLVALFCGVTNCPVSSLILSVELFGAKGFGFFAVVVAVSFMLSGYYGLYSEQKIVYSKLKPEFIDKKVE